MTERIPAEFLSIYRSSESQSSSGRIDLYKNCKFKYGHKFIKNLVNRITILIFFRTFIIALFNEIWWSFPEYCHKKHKYVHWNCLIIFFEIVIYFSEFGFQWIDSFCIVSFNTTNTATSVVFHWFTNEWTTAIIVVTTLKWTKNNCIISMKNSDNFCNLLYALQVNTRRQTSL